MKTVTAKEFQQHQSQMMKEVAHGTVYQVTYHGRPWVELRPSVRRAGSRAPAGSPQAFQNSLRVSLSLTASSLPDRPDYKEIRRQQLRQKYGSR